MENEMTGPEEAKRALLYAIVGVFFLGFILGPLAIVKGVRVRRESQEGRTMASVALGIGILATLSGCAILVRVVWNIWVGNYPPGP